jgi:hypothetical protein
MHFAWGVPVRLRSHALLSIPTRDDTGAPKYPGRAELLREGANTTHLDGAAVDGVTVAERGYAALDFQVKGHVPLAAKVAVRCVPEESQGAQCVGVLWAPSSNERETVVCHTNNEGQARVFGREVVRDDQCDHKARATPAVPESGEPHLLLARTHQGKLSFWVGEELFQEGTLKGDIPRTVRVQAWSEGGDAVAEVKDIEILFVPERHVQTRREQ